MAWVAALAAVFWGFFWFGPIDLLVVIEQDERFREHYLFESGWGLLHLVLVGIPLVVLAMRPGDPIALAQLAVLVGALWGVAWPQLWNGLGLAFTVGLLVWLGRASRIDAKPRGRATSAADTITAHPTPR